MPIWQYSWMPFGKDGKGKGKGKGKVPAPAPKAAAKAAPSTPIPKATPLGKRFEMKMLAKDKVEGTVFADLADVSVDVACLRALFEEQPKGSKKNRRSSCPAPRAKREQVELLPLGRAQSVMIALKKQPLTPGVLRALELLDFDAEALTPEVCQVLLGAVPSPEEAGTLRGYSGDPAELRDVERQLLPLATMQHPSVGERLRIMLFKCTMQDLCGNVKGDLTSVRTALDDARSSIAFRVVLHHTVRLGTMINFNGGAEASAVVGGFNLDALARMAQFKAPGNSRVSLMHVLVAQVFAADADLPRKLVEDLRSVHRAAERPIAPLVEDIAAFCSEADHIAACAAARPDGVECSAEGASASASARLATLARSATAEAAGLREQLASARQAAKAALAYFAMPVFQPKDIDAKALELCALLSSFASAFERARAQIASDPLLAAACHRKAPGARPKAMQVPDCQAGG